MPSLKKFRGLILLPAALMLAGCNTLLMNPSGDVADQQGRLIVVSTFLMLLIIVPVIGLTIFFAWRYRASNKEATYEPDWDHSTQLELIIWAAPLLIIIALGAVTWISTHTLDPYARLRRIDATRPMPVDAKPLVVEVVALDWKWLFIYPEQGIATVNELAAPIDVPITFRITASDVMNSFYIPALAGQIYAMPSMETQLHAVINKGGVFDGFSSNYSGAGFSHMRFKFHGMSPADFDKWVEKVKGDTRELSRADYVKLAQPSERVPVSYYGNVENELFEAVLNRCVEAGQTCINQMMTQNMHATSLALAKRAIDEMVCSVDNPDGLPLASLGRSPKPSAKQ